MNHSDLSKGKLKEKPQASWISVNLIIYNQISLLRHIVQARTINDIQILFNKSEQTSVLKCKGLLKGYNALSETITHSKSENDYI